MLFDLIISKVSPDCGDFLWIIEIALFFFYYFFLYNSENTQQKTPQIKYRLVSCQSMAELIKMTNNIMYQKSKFKNNEKNVPASYFCKETENIGLMISIALVKTQTPWCISCATRHVLRKMKRVFQFFDPNLSHKRSERVTGDIFVYICLLEID